MSRCNSHYSDVTAQAVASLFNLCFLCARCYTPLQGRFDHVLAMFNPPWRRVCDVCVSVCLSGVVLTVCVSCSIRRGRSLTPSLEPCCGGVQQAVLGCVWQLSSRIIAHHVRALRPCDRRLFYPEATAPGSTPLAQAARTSSAQKLRQQQDNKGARPGLTGTGQTQTHNTHASFMYTPAKPSQQQA